MSHVEGISLQRAFDQREAGVLQQGNDRRQRHHQAVQLPKVTGWKTDSTDKGKLVMALFSNYCTVKHI